MVPVVGLGFMMGSKVQYAVANSQRAIDAAKEQLAKIEANFNFDITSKIDTSAITDGYRTIFRILPVVLLI